MCEYWYECVGVHMLLKDGLPSQGRIASTTMSRMRITPTKVAASAHVHARSLCAFVCGLVCVVGVKGMSGWVWVWVCA